MRAVMLAAGDGGRLGPYTETTPKPLVNVNGRPLAGYTLDALSTCGVSEVVVVTGYREEQVIAGLGARSSSWPELRFVPNPRFHEGAAYSVRAARESVGNEPFLLVMSDHLLSAGLIRDLLDARLLAEPGRSLVATDSAPREEHYVEEATKVLADAAGRVLDIGKGLERWTGLDTGAFVIAPSAWDAFDQAPENCELSQLLAPLIGAGALSAADVGGQFWYDVDTVEDLEAATALLAAQALLTGDEPERQPAR